MVGFVSLFKAEASQDGTQRRLKKNRSVRLPGQVLKMCWASKTKVTWPKMLAAMKSGTDASAAEVDDSIKIKPDSKADVIGTPLPPDDSTLKTEGRTIHDVFDFTDKKARKKREKRATSEASYGAPIINLCLESDNWFKNAGVEVGNWLTKIIQKAGSDLVHKKIEAARPSPFRMKKAKG